MKWCVDDVVRRKIITKKKKHKIANAMECLPNEHHTHRYPKTTTLRFYSSIYNFMCISNLFLSYIIYI